MKISVLCLLLGAALLAGCQTTPMTTATLTYETTPGGAELFEGDTSIGLAPVTRTYTGDPKTGQVTTPDVKAVWPSGATVTYFTIIPVGSDRQATLERPAKAPGLEQDLANAKKVAAAQAMEAARNKALQHSDLARASARCQAQMQGGNRGLTDDCN